MTEIRVLAVDDRLSIHAALEALFAIYDDMTLVGEARDGYQAPDLCARTYPDVVLMDISMPWMELRRRGLSGRGIPW